MSSLLKSGAAQAVVPAHCAITATAIAEAIILLFDMRFLHIRFVEFCELRTARLC
ncbi:MAG: hypothetical protein WDM84_04495 [Bauldia sp.]